MEANYPYALKNQLRAAVHVHDLWVRIREKYQRLPCVQLFLIAGEYEVVLGTGGSRIVDQLELLHQMFSLPFQFPVSRLGATSVSNSDPGIQPPRQPCSSYLHSSSPQPAEPSDHCRIVCSRSGVFLPDSFSPHNVHTNQSLFLSCLQTNIP